MKATAKQLDYIHAIEEDLGVVFDGETIEEASEFLNKYVPEHKRYLRELHLEHEADLLAIDSRRDW